MDVYIYILVVFNGLLYIEMDFIQWNIYGIIQYIGSHTLGVSRNEILYNGGLQWDTNMGFHGKSEYYLMIIEHSETDP